MELPKVEALYPILLHRYADDFSRLDVPVNFLDETLSILYTFHDPENKYTLPAKIAEFTFTYQLADNQEKAKAALEIFLHYYKSVEALIAEIAVDYHINRLVKKLSTISDALLEICGGYQEKNRTTIIHWLKIILQGMIKRFNIPTQSSQSMVEYVNATFHESMAKAFHTAIALLGKISSTECEYDDLPLAISVLFICTAMVFSLRNTALSLLQKGEISE
ncbi:MAG: hypothetical protein N2316_03480 [Spirochaetes bacterium]|nr:hypothetical protein [Spirochaetota bacterium]